MARPANSRRHFVLVCALLAVVTCAPRSAWCDENAPRVDFEQQIAPLLVKNCLGCHAGADPAGGLNLTSQESLSAGGDSGAVIDAAQPLDSLLLTRVRDGEMPPPEKGNPLSAQDIARLSAWVSAGATWPEKRVLSAYDYSTEKQAGLDWWSLRAPVRPEVATVAGSNWPRNPIDAFILERLQREGLAPSVEADRATLLRRVKFDLVGLPPTPEEVDAFLADSNSDAYERLVDRLLASPQYGERWARHWLDVVRFGETDGYETNKPRPAAWPYRDYVIRALNEDKPYAQFVLEQLAGDQVGTDEATGFLVGGTHDVVGIQNIEGQLQQRANDLDDILVTTATTFLGL